MKTNLTFISFKIVLPIILVGFANMSIAKVSKSTEYCNSGSSSIECRKIKTITNYKNNGSGDWLKSNDAFQFRTRDGSGCKIRGHLTRGSNSKLTISFTVELSPWL